MNVIATSIAAVVVVLGVMILVHEWGHYAAAKLFGVRVEVFSIGFGKRLLGFRRGETDYRISALPLGGYVKMSGENPMDERTGDPGEFMSHPRWQRFIIALAGPAMNIILAVVLLTGVFMVHYEHPAHFDQPAVIGWVLEDSAAERSGLRQGDRIVRIEDVQNPVWEQVYFKELMNPELPVDLAVDRNGQIMQVEIVPKKTGSEGYGSAGWLPDQPNIVTTLEASMPAAKAGMQLGDEIVAINGKPMPSMVSVSRYLQENKQQPIEVTVVRAGQELKFNMVPAAVQDGGTTQYRIGYASQPTHVDKLPFGEAVKRSLERNRQMSLLIVELVQKMVQGKLSLKQMDGPIGIARVSGEAARQKGWMPLLLLMAAISLNLGIFNLFPIPILDGGVILLLAIESIMRRDISVRIKERIYQASFVFLILFAAVVIYNDIVKLFFSRA